MSPEHALPAGAEVAAYRIDGVLGRGGMAVVYRATHPEREDAVALKVIEAPKWGADAQSLLEHESRLAAAVAHRHILPVYEAGADDGRPYVAMRLERCDLAAVLRREGRLSPARAVVYVSQVAAALDAAHAHGLVHRDVKPSNVLLGEDEEGRERVAVADFGVARAAFTTVEPLADQLVGTIGYLSPEQIRGEAVDQRTDVYALGCLLYECLTGRIPFRRGTSLATLWAHLHDDPQPPSVIAPELSPVVDAVVVRALQKDPRSRYASAGALAEAAREAVDGRRRERSRPTPAQRELPTGTVTFVFTDVEGSTKLLHALGAEAYGEALAEHREIIRAACAEEGGVEVDTQGDAFFFAFPDAEGALAAARVFTPLLTSTPIRVRVGVHTGTPHLTSEGYVGADVHRAARIASAGHGGQVLVSEQTAALVASGELHSLGSHRLKDFDGPVRLYQANAGSFSPLKTIANTNLPTPASSFLGREPELRAADELLRDARLLTITGPGGAGKTRFCLELATRAREERFSDYQDGVFACFLAPLRDPALVLPTIAQTLSVHEVTGSSALETLSAQLLDKSVLLVLDNAEHLLACAGELSQLLERCPRLTLLVTSRELLRVAGENAYPLPPLPDEEAIVLFCERGAVEPSATIGEICRRLDGLPLALELAAARLRLLSPEQLLERLASRLDLLKGSRDADPRQQTLRATIEWSYDLLSVEEQALFARLSVFAGGCTLEAAEEVAHADLDTLESLLDKSLLRRMDTDAGPRFWMLETIREYATEKLEAAGSVEQACTAHAEFLRTYLDEPDLRGRAEWHLRLEVERSNVRAALVWALEHAAADLYLALASEYGALCMMRGPVAEGASFLAAAVARDDAEATAARARALWGLGALQWRLGDLASCLASHEESLSVSREVGDARMEGRSLRALGIGAAETGDAARSERYLNEAIAVFRTIGDEAEVAECLNMLGYSALVGEDFAGAKRFFEEAVALGREVGDRRGVMRCVGNLAWLAVLERRFADSRMLSNSRARGSFSRTTWASSGPWEAPSSSLPESLPSWRATSGAQSCSVASTSCTKRSTTHSTLESSTSASVSPRCCCASSVASRSMRSSPPAEPWPSTTSLPTRSTRFPMPEQLTPPTSFLGRETELADGERLLREARLLTVTGPGGAGKTSYALELARRTGAGFHGGSFVCAFAALRNAELVLPTIARTLGVPEERGRSVLELVTDRLRGTETLLVLDNLEHLPESRADVADLAFACPELTLLCTSRQRLGIEVEVAYELPSLRLDDAVALFCERAQVEPTDEIREVCARLEGLPLAIELAASRLALLTPEQLLERLSRRLELLKGPRDTDPRQRTLRATIEWSYDLLSADEQRLFAFSSVFRAGFTLDAAQAVCGADAAALESLCAKSLLRVRDERFSMLETIREFAAERLAASGDAHGLEQRHAEHLVAFCAPAAEHGDTGEGEWIAVLADEEANVRAALAYLERTGQTGLHFELAGSVWFYWYVVGAWREGRRWTEGLLARATCEPSRARARVELGAAALASVMGDTDKAEVLASGSLATVREIGDLQLLSPALTCLGMIASQRGQHEVAADFAAQAADAARRAGMRFYLAEALYNLCDSCLRRGEYGRALRLQQEGESIMEEVGSTWGLGGAKLMRSFCLFYLDDVDGAIASLRERPDLLVALLTDPWMQYSATVLAAAIAVRRLDVAVAARLLDAADVIVRRTGMGMAPGVESHLHAVVADELDRLEPGRASEAPGEATSVEAAREALLEFLANEPVTA
jgi:predicted ATPase/class 3 adenylate cyclase